MIELCEPFASLWKHKDPFVEVEKLDGEVFRALESRRTLRFTLKENSYFIKIHRGTALKEALKNLVSFRLPVLGADREWKAIHRLAEQGVDTMKGVGFGQRGVNPLSRHSFIITEDLNPTISLEDYCAIWQESPPSVKEKRRLIQRLAEMVRKMHAGGVNHRDCYICHFLLHLPYQPTDTQFKISVIDLHRAQIRDRVPLRWRNKDLIGLYFSSLDIGLTKKDLLWFLKIYFYRQTLRSTLQHEQSLFQQARVKAEKIRVRTERKAL
ncbi:lipopolysaccharide core heptose(I) kinase RfaP [Pectobacterium parmentieri]|uniref:Lipopolysaccharide core heptose(I) kinase n=1 Tax=Pectobacterium parmentieri TaxID=1905730 RepID=A0A8B3G6T2_PECPM|nr:lipopolysaccharide core heptose(I) kinase RfaP [Pectobacterium parmentieri]AOR61070.1 lipopolysaccharide core heptose(I) kinase RfaP [Pectobacterium parmentieri]AYH07783.1 lipopolysaccharide core heptose(I) kinase RfaP [Pectobacterium parmentieri]AYH12261.1 lipopolysaccharide core heptose(I) kinase RfaP [Pectobacterium parmentieri]AYH16535.1 lipopolysaccharide core heptose(I) kinase RfaP [Pectobacterium parmentieri]AYH20977.1 lipopolysaccharide core heptose(I) kinase RfaP [Pectobacterium pa